MQKNNLKDRYLRKQCDLSAYEISEEREQDLLNRINTLIRQGNDVM